MSSLVILEGLLSTNDAEAVAHKIGVELKPSFAFENLVLLPVASSIGAVVFVGDGVDPAEVVARAEKALYQAKRDTFVVTHW